jgi:hypothetical protein
MGPQTGAAEKKKTYPKKKPKRKQRGAALTKNGCSKSKQKRQNPVQIQK